MTIESKTIKDHAIPILLLCLISVFIHRNWFQDGIYLLGENTYFDQEFIKDSVSMPYLWESRVDGGRSGIIWSCRHPVRFCWGVLGTVLPPQAATLIIYGLTCMLLPCISMYCFVFGCFRSRLAAFAGGFLFAFNSYILTLQQGGQISECLAIACMPLVLLFYFKSLDDLSLRDSLFAGLCFALTICFSARFAFLLGFCCLFFIFFSLCSPAAIKSNILKKLSLAGIFVLIPVMLHSYWLIPLGLHTGMPGFGNYYQPSWITALSSSTLKHTAALHTHFWGSFPDYKVMQVNPLYWAIPALALLGWLFHIKRAKAWYFLLIALTGILLAKGSNPPFERLYRWLFLNLPGFSGFRDASKMYTFIALGYSPLFGLGLAAVYKKANTFHFSGKAIIFAAAAALLTGLAFPGLKDPLVGGTFKPEPFPAKEYADIKNFLVQHAPDYYSLHYPRFGKFSFYCEDYPCYGTPSTFSPYENYFYRIDWDPNVLKKTDRLGSILGSLNIKYIVLNQAYPAYQPAELSKLRTQLLDQQSIVATGNYRILENLNALPRFYMSPVSTLVVGGMGATHDLVNDNPDFFKSHVITNIEAIPADDLFDRLEQADELFFYHQHWKDLVLAALVRNHGLNLWAHADWAGENELNTTWTRTTVPPHGNPSTNNGALAFARPGILECTMGEALLSAPFSVKSEDTYEIWIRALHGPVMGSIEVTVDSEPPGERFQKSDHTVYRWVHYGTYRLTAGRHRLKIKAVGNGQHQMDQAVVVPQTELIETAGRILNIIKNKPIRVPGPNGPQSAALHKDGFSAIDGQAAAASGRSAGKAAASEIQWKKINPTRYELKANIAVPGTLVFAQTFDPGWVLKQGGKKPAGSRFVNSRLNGFRITEAGPQEFTVEYAPQRYVWIGLWISLATLAAVILTLAKTRRKGAS